MNSIIRRYVRRTTLLFFFSALFATIHPQRAGAQRIEWIRQFGTAGDDNTWGLAVDPTGVYVVGDTNGALPGQTSAGALDAFVRKFDANGNELWPRQFGTAGGDTAHGLAAYATGVYVTGFTVGALPDGTG